MKLPSKGELTRNTLWMSLGQGLRLLIQAAFFTLIARSLGTSNYGAFTGVAAFVGILTPFGGLGAGSLLIRDVARDPAAFRDSWGRALGRTLFFGSALVIVSVLLSRFTLPSGLPRLLILLVALSDVLGLNLLLLSAFAFQAFERLNWTSGIYVLISASRLAAVVVLIALYPHPTALQWSVAYLASTVIAALIAFAVAVAKLGWPRLSVRSSRSDLTDGSYFAAGLSAQTIYNDLDKTMLARLSTLDATGIYGAAYRIVEVSFAPVSALLSSAYPKFFRVGQRGIAASIAFAKPLMLGSLAFSLAICILLGLSAGVIPVLLGQKFAPAVVALRWLAWLLPLRAAHSFLSDVLTSANRQSLRTLIQVGVAAVNALLNLWAIPAFGWRGAVVTSLASDGLLVVSIGTAVWLVVRATRKKSNIAEPMVARTAVL